MAAALAIILVAAAIAGCTTGSKSDGMLIGADIFDPDRFGMAIYDVTVAAGDGVSRQGFIVASGTSGTDGDVLTSIAFHGNVSTRADTLISHDHRKTLNVLISDINESAVQFSGGTPMFNMTTIDRAWNALDNEYRYFYSTNVTVPAGTFDGCKVYWSDKMLVFDDASSTVQVLYYMHPSVAVPVMFEVKGPADTYTYRLERVYEQGDAASTPERAVQSFFDDLDNGRLGQASEHLVTYDQDSGGFEAPDDATCRQFIENMNRTYRTGDASYRVQFVDVRAVVPITTLQSDSMCLVQWEIIHYHTGTLIAYRLSGSFNMTEIGGQWRIIV